MARITVIGGTGYAGAAIVEEAVARGHEVTAVSRNAPTEPVEGATYVQGSTVDAAFVDGVAAGADVVVTATSPRGDNEDVYTTITGNVASAAQKAGARLVVIGGFSSLRPAPGAPRFIETGVPEAYQVEAAAGHAYLERLQAWDEALDWVFVSPAAKFGAFNPGPKTGEYRIGDDVAILDEQGVSTLSAGNLAVAVLDVIEKDEPHRAHIQIVE